METNNILKIKIAECSGCKLCGLICPVNAISFDGEELFPHPIVNAEKCIGCGKCLSLCPANAQHAPQRSSDLEGYICNSPNLEQVKRSASGGVFGQLAKQLFKCSYQIAGAVYTEHFQSVTHIFAENEADIDRMSGSKYSVSEAANAYKETAERLEKGEKVVFSGTGCQCAAVRSLCGAYLNDLLLIQIVCKGAIPARVLSTYMDALQKEYGGQVVSYSMRGKCAPNKIAYEQVEFSDGSKRETEFYKTVYGRVFSCDAVLRDSCYHCKFRNGSFSGDIVIGDYTEPCTLPNQDWGCSTVIAVTEKGRAIIENSDLCKEAADTAKLLSVCRRTRIDVKRSLVLNRKKLLACLSCGSEGLNSAVDYMEKRKFFIKIQRKANKLIDRIRN